ncbi:MAG: hypothetical protein ABIP89_10290, partial [Polyangiaceae bacterium]
MLRGRWTVLFFLVGCGAGKPAPAAMVSGPVSVAEAGAPASSAPFVSDVAMAKMPPPFQFGSKKAAKRVHPEWASCSVVSPGARAPSADLDADVTTLA